MPEIIFPSKWLKANVNCKEGDTITFLNVGEYDKKEEQWIFKVRVLRTGDEKLFSLNKKNFAATSALYGSNSDSWAGKMMKVKVITVENPRTGGEVDAIRLHDPASPDLPDATNDSDSPITAFD
jgi:hypothetical protein